MSTSGNSLTEKEYILSLERTTAAMFPGYSLTDALKFDFPPRSSGDSSGVQCILTITRPDGARRVYEGRTCHSHNDEAKVEAAENAVENGAIEFIVHGNDKMQDSQELEQDSNVLEIESACKIWCPAKQPPACVFYHIFGTAGIRLQWGAALRVELTVARVYSTDTVYATAREAKAGCAKVAIDRGVIHDIKNLGQTPGVSTAVVQLVPAQKPTAVISLETWFKALRRPRWRCLRNKSPAEIDAPELLNKTIREAKGTRLKIDYFWPTIHISGPSAASSAAVGCLLRIHRPGKCFSYLVDPLFRTRDDARHAVALLAMFQDAVGSIKEMGLEVQNKITPRLRSLMHEQIVPLLDRESDSHSWTFHTDRDAYGCTLVVDLGLEELMYVTEPGYSTQADAKAAATLMAAELGLVELLRFRGKLPPPGYQTFLETFRTAVQVQDGSVVHGKPRDTPQVNAPTESNVEHISVDEGVLDRESEPQEDVDVLKIESACREYGQLPPDWLFYCESESGDTPVRWGTALRIPLDVAQVYSTDMIYSTIHEARASCAKLAIDHNVIHHIKDSGVSGTEKPEPFPKPTTATSIEAWSETLALPLQELFGTKTATQIDASSMLDAAIVEARGGQFKIDYFWPTKSEHGLIGCVLRLHRPQECRSYLVDPLFATQCDARNAVSLLAVSQHAIDYIKQVGTEVGKKLTTQLRRLVKWKIRPVLYDECSRGNIDWEISTSRDAFGCTLVVRLGPEVHEYVTEPEYNSKKDAKTAAALLAAELGVIELIRFHGEPPPPDHQMFWEGLQPDLQESRSLICERPQKRMDVDDNPPPRKRKRKRGREKKGTHIAAASTPPETITGSAQLSKPSRSENKRVVDPQRLPVTTARVHASGKGLAKTPSKASLFSSNGEGDSLGTLLRSEPKAHPTPAPQRYLRPTLGQSPHMSIPPPPVSKHGRPMRPLPLPYEIDHTPSGSH
ncbi:hypothetical protein FPV67DRAFT_1760567 [Lyophyllum atratum]|nr:hypothetical protein FPV67DRAFT_1760567 [Lyophyllum atratum]